MSLRVLLRIACNDCQDDNDFFEKEFLIKQGYVIGIECQPYFFLTDKGKKLVNAIVHSSYETINGCR